MDIYWHTITNTDLRACLYFHKNADPNQNAH